MTTNETSKTSNDAGIRICNCKHCSRAHKINQLIDRLPNEFKVETDELFGELIIDLAGAETDYGVLTSKIEGSWPLDDNGNYYERVNGKLYRVCGFLVEEKQECNHDLHETSDINGECDSCCQCEYDLDGGPCKHCGKTAVE